jgi:hypothetical protein
MKNCVLLLALLACSTGCATIMTGYGPSQSIRIASEPKGADVYADGALIGKTPTVASLTRKDDHTIKLVLDGYPDKTVQISNTYNGWFWGNFLFGGLDGMVVDLLDGACTGALSPNEVEEAWKPNPNTFHMSTTVAPEDAMPKRDIYAPAVQ